MASISIVSSVLGVVTFIIAMSLFNLFGRNKFIVDGRTVLLTGGSEGMGLEVAKILSSKGANVVIVSRSVSKLENAIKQIEAAAKLPEKQRFHYISADVTTPEENIRIVNEVTKWNNGNPPDIVWANAGSAMPGLFLDTSIETFKKQMDINYFAAVYLAHAIFKIWLTGSSSGSKSGESPLPRHFVITSSVAAFVGLAGYSPYSPAKAALRNLHDTLRSELLLYNHAKPEKSGQILEVKIHTVFPGTILSPGLDNENISKHAVTHELEKSDPRQTPEEVARITITELEKGRQMITTQWLGMIMKSAGLMVSIRDNWLVDTMLGALLPIIVLFINIDLEGTVKKWARSHGRPQHQI